MDPLLLGAIVAIATIVVLFSGVSVALGLLIVSAGFLIIFDGMRSLLRWVGGGLFLPECFDGIQRIRQMFERYSIVPSCCCL